MRNLSLDDKQQSVTFDYVVVAAEFTLGF